MTALVGLDLSLRAAAACAIPYDAWDGKLDYVRTMMFGYDLPNTASPKDKLARIHSIADGVTKFCAGVDAKAIYIEEYAFSQGQAHAHEIGEVGGVVKHRLFRKLGLVTIPVANNTARKTLLVKLPSPRGKPKGYVKSWVWANVRRLEGSARVWTNDEVDAFVIANHGIAAEGSTALSFEGIDP